MIKSNLNKIRTELVRLSSKPIRLVAVSKTKPAEYIKEAYDAGQVHFGENYVNEIIEKASALPPDILWHFIGHLQSNKVKKLISECPNLYMIETIDSIKLAEKVDRALSDVPRSTKLKVLVEVKTSQEESKSGIDPFSVNLLVDTIISNCKYIEFDGLMTIADPTKPDESFRMLSDIAKFLQARSIPVNTISMGMSGDYALAIEHGSNEVRIGSSIFGSREYTNS
jgi:pyridoxal phosphate enzyme (YggS family)